MSDFNPGDIISVRATGVTLGREMVEESPDGHYYVMATDAASITVSPRAGMLSTKIDRDSDLFARVELVQATAILPGAVVQIGKGKVQWNVMSGVQRYGAFTLGNGKQTRNVNYKDADTLKVLISAPRAAVEDNATTVENPATSEDAAPAQGFTGAGKFALGETRPAFGGETDISVGDTVTIGDGSTEYTVTAGYTDSYVLTGAKGNTVDIARNLARHLTVVRRVEKTVIGEDIASSGKFVTSAVGRKATDISTLSVGDEVTVGNDRRSIYAIAEIRDGSMVLYSDDSRMTIQTGTPASPFLFLVNSQADENTGPRPVDINVGEIWELNDARRYRVIAAGERNAIFGSLDNSYKHRTVSRVALRTGAVLRESAPVAPVTVEVPQDSVPADYDPEQTYVDARDYVALVRPELVEDNATPVTLDKPAPVPSVPQALNPVNAAGTIRVGLRPVAAPTNRAQRRALMKARGAFGKRRAR